MDGRVVVLSPSVIFIQAIQGGDGACSLDSKTNQP